MKLDDYAQHINITIITIIFLVLAFLLQNIFEFDKSELRPTILYSVQNCRPTDKENKKLLNIRKIAYQP